MKKHRVLVYYNRWSGWSLWKDDCLTKIGFLSNELDYFLRQWCNQNARRVGWSIGLVGWEL